MLEVEYCNFSTSVHNKLLHLYMHVCVAKDCAAPLDESQQSFIAVPFDGEELKGREKQVAASELAIARLEGKRNLSVVERQELWLAKKNVKVAKAQQCIAKEKMAERAQSAPDLSRSRESFRALKRESTTTAKTRTRKRAIVAVRKGCIDPKANQISKRQRLTPGLAAKGH